MFNFDFCRGWSEFWGFIEISPFSKRNVSDFTSRNLLNLKSYWDLIVVCEFIAKEMSKFELLFQSISVLRVLMFKTPFLVESGWKLQWRYMWLSVFVHSVAFYCFDVFCGGFSSSVEEGEIFMSLPEFSEIIRKMSDISFWMNSLHWWFKSGLLMALTCFAWTFNRVYWCLRISLPFFNDHGLYIFLL